MAKIDGKILRGIIGPVITREHRGQQLIYLKSGRKVRQTSGTKRSTCTFTMAIRLAGNIRRSFSSLVYGFQDGTWVNRLNSDVALALYNSRDTETLLFNFKENSFDQLSGFDYNIKSPLRKSLIVKPHISVLNGILTVALPQLNIPDQLKFPESSSFCELIAGVSFFRLGDGKMVQKAEQQTVSIAKDKGTLDAHEFKFDIPNDTLCVVSLFLHFYNYYGNHANLLNCKNFSPAGICAAVLSPGTYAHDHSRFWINMEGLQFAQRLKQTA